MKKQYIILVFLAFFYNAFSQEDITTEYLAWAEDGNLEEVKKYVAKGADINAISEGGYNAGEYALWNYDEGDELILYLLDQGLNVNLTNEEGENLLHIAAEYEAASIIPKIVELGGDINAQNEDGATPIIVAAENEDFIAVQVLSDQGADLSIENEDGKSVVHFFDIEEQEQWDLLKKLNLSQKQKDILLYKAIYDIEDSEKVNALIDLGADVNAKDEEGTPLILFAAESDNIEILQSLISAKVDVNSVDEEGLSALWYCYDNERLKLLIESGIDVNQIPEGYDSPLFRAIKRGDVEGVKFLLEAGADPNLKVDGQTAYTFSQALQKLEIAPMAENYANPEDQKEHTKKWKGELKEIAKLLK